MWQHIVLEQWLGIKRGLFIYRNMMMMMMQCIKSTYMTMLATMTKLFAKQLSHHIHLRAHFCQILHIINLLVTKENIKAEQKSRNSCQTICIPGFALQLHYTCIDMMQVLLKVMMTLYKVVLYYFTRKHLKTEALINVIIFLIFYLSIY